MNNEEKILEILEKHDKVLDRIMNRLDRLESTQGEMQETLTRVAVTQEGVVLPKLQLLFEGQENLRQTLAPKERVEVLEDEVVTLKTMVKMIGKRLAALEQAQ